MIELGDTHRISVSCVDAAGAPSNPATATCTITAPDGTTTSPVVALPPAETGRLLIDWVPAQTGRHTLVVTTTGPVWAHRDVLDVRQPELTILMSLRDAKKHLNLDPNSTSDDEEIRDFLESITAIVEYHAGATLERTYVQRTTGNGPTIALHYAPVTELTSIEAIGSGTGYDVADVDIDPRGFLTLLSGARWRGRLRVTYRAGYRQIPANRIQAAKIILGHFWETQRPVSTRRFLPSERDTMQAADGSGRWFSIPRKAMELLEIDMQGGVA